MTRRLTISLDQLYRRAPGGIGTYVRGLLQGLSSLDDHDLEVIGLAPLGRTVAGPPATPRIVHAPLPVELATRVWSVWPLGVARGSNIVHATSMAGPFSGGARAAVHSVALHDLLWRDEPAAATSAGIRFHEQRLKLIAAREELRVFASAPGLRERLIHVGIDGDRIHDVRLGVDDGGAVLGEDETRVFLSSRGIDGPFTLYAGTVEPRKNIDRLVAAHSMAREERPELGPLVLVGPGGWGDVSTGSATVLGLVDRSVLKGLYSVAAMFTYVPIAEGFGLPPVEALHAGARVVASSTTPSVLANTHVVRVDPLDVSAIAAGLVAALDQPTDEAGVARRRASVEDLTWRNCALDHLAGWR